MEEMEESDLNENSEQEEIEGYKKCSNHKQKCLTDCWPFHNSLISDIE